MCLYRKIIPARIVSNDGQFYELRTTDGNNLVFTVHKSMLPSHNPKKGDTMGLKLTRLGSQLLVKKCIALNEQEDKHIEGGTEVIAGEVIMANSHRINISTFDNGKERIVHGFPKRDNRCPSISEGDPVFAEVTEKKGQLIATRIWKKPAFISGAKREATGRVPSRR